MPNLSGSSWERSVDNFMAGIQSKVGDLLDYTSSPKGKEQIQSLETFGALGSAVILGFASPLTVLTSAVAGIVIKSFSSDQVDDLRKSLGTLSAQLPGSVKILAATIAMTFARILFPISAGLYLGLQLGPSLNPSSIAGVLDQAKAAAQGKRSAVEVA